MAASLTQMSIAGRYRKLVTASRHRKTKNDEEVGGERFTKRIMRDKRRSIVSGAVLCEKNVLADVRS